MKLIFVLFAVMTRSINLNLLSALDDKVNHPIQQPRSCADLKASGERVNGVFTVFKENYDGTLSEVRIYCDFRDDEGWTVIQRRCDGSENFYRSWDDYQNGFGDYRMEFWIGNTFLQFVTSTKIKIQLRVELTDFNNVTVYADYDDFYLSAGSTLNTLVKLGNYTGTAGDSLSYARMLPFSTFDRNNDGNNCSGLEHGAWWYSDCGESNLNGIYNCTNSSPAHSCISWKSWKPEYTTPFKTVEMKIRRQTPKQLS